MASERGPFLYLINYATDLQLAGRSRLRDVWNDGDWRRDALHQHPVNDEKVRQQPEG